LRVVYEFVVRRVRVLFDFFFFSCATEYVVSACLKHAQCKSMYRNNSLLRLVLLHAKIAFARRLRCRVRCRQRCRVRCPLQCEFDSIRGLPLQLQRAQLAVQNLW
jgi:hypothetical protein